MTGDRNKLGQRQKLDFYFDQVAPITGDGIYKRVEDGGMIRHALLINPDAAIEQARVFRVDKRLAG